jgi:hypothetical protein
MLQFELERETQNKGKRIKSAWSQNHLHFTVKGNWYVEVCHYPKR